MDWEYSMFQVCRLEKTLGNKIKFNFSSFHAGVGLSSSQGRALHYFLGLRKKEKFQKDYENEFDVKASSASAVIKQLEDKGFIERECLDRDSRLKKITLTDKALKLKGQVENDIEVMQNKLLKNVSKKDYDVFCQVCQQMIDNLSE